MLPAPPVCFLPLSSPLSPSHELPCGQIWFNFLCPLKGNETSGRDLREHEREDVSDGDLAECARAAALGLPAGASGGVCSCHLVWLMCMQEEIYLCAQAVGVRICTIVCGKCV